MSHVTVKEVATHSGETGVFGEIFVGLGLLILFGAIALWMFVLSGFFDHSVVGKVAARNDAFVLWFLLAIEGLGFTIFGAMVLLSGWDRTHHPDDVQ